MSRIPDLSFIIEDIVKNAIPERGNIGMSPTPGENLHWILVLDDSKANFVKLGKVAYTIKK